MSLDLDFAFTIVVALFLLYVVAQAIWIFREYERGVVFTLGRYTKTIGPGLTFVIPIIQKVVRVDLRVKVEDVPTQDVISRDNVSVKVNAVIYYRVIDPARALRLAAERGLLAGRGHWHDARSEGGGGMDCC